MDDRDRPLVLRWGNGLGVFGFAIGALLVFAFGGVGVFAIRDVARNGLDAGAVLGLGFVLFVFATGVWLALFTTGAKIDRARGTASTWVGLAFVPLWIRHHPLGNAPRPFVTTRTVSGRGGRTTTHVVRIETASGHSFEVQSFDDPTRAEELRVRIARHFGVAAPVVPTEPDRIATIECASCGAPVPIRDADSSRCSRCGADVLFPADVRATFAERRRADAEVARAEAIFARLGEVPGTFEHVAANVPALFLVPFLPATLLLLGIALPVWLREGAARLAPWVGFDPVDRFGGYPFTFVLPAALGVAFLPLVLRVRRAKVLAAVRVRAAEALLAVPPVASGGAATCRSCGAPLVYGEGALGVVCRHCAAPNVVTPPAGLARALRAHAQREHADLDAVERAFAEGEVAARRAERRAIGIAIAFVVAATVLGGAVLDPPASFAKRVGEPRYAEAFPAYCEDLPLASPKSLPFPNDWGSSSCTYRVPLRRGDVASLHTDASDLAVRFSHSDALVWDVPIVDSVATFTAPFDGWYSLRLGLPTQAKRRLTVTWDVTPSR